VAIPDRGWPQGAPCVRVAGSWRAVPSGDGEPTLSVSMTVRCRSGPIMTYKSSGCIGHPEDLGIGQVYSLSLGQVTSLCCKARAMASARLETPSLDRMLLT
jgi:hypothetical protein